MNDTININVSKMPVKIELISDKIAYDGNEHIPEYVLKNPKGEVINDSSITVNYTGQKGKEVGSYFYNFNIESNNHQGSAMGYFNIEVAKIFITIERPIDNQGNVLPIEMTIGNEVPEILYKVEMIDSFGNKVEVSDDFKKLLGIDIIIPKINVAKTYDIKFEINNSNYKPENYEVTNGKGALKVNPKILGATEATVANQAYYGDKLSDITFENVANGYWGWNYKDDLGNVINAENIDLNRAGTWVIEAIFTPYDLNNYDYEYQIIDLEVMKKPLTINFDPDQNRYVFEEGVERKVSFDIEGFVLGDTIDDIKVIDTTTGEEVNISSIDVINYSTKLEIESPNYSGSKSVSLQITQAEHDIDFSSIKTSVVKVGSKLNQALFLTYGDNISVSELPGILTWDAGNIEMKISDNGVTYKVKFTPNSSNYKPVYGDVVVNVERHSTSIKIPDTLSNSNYHYEFDYSGNIYMFDYIGSEDIASLDGIKKGHNDNVSSLEYTYYLITSYDEDGNEVLKKVDYILNAGLYRVEIKLAENSFYAEATNFVYVNVNKIGVGSANEPSRYSGIYGETLADLGDVLPESTYGTWSWVIHLKLNSYHLQNMQKTMLYIQ